MNEIASRGARARSTAAGASGIARSALRRPTMRGGARSAPNPARGAASRARVQPQEGAVEPLPRCGVPKMGVPMDSRTGQCGRDLAGLPERPYIDPRVHDTNALKGSKPSSCPSAVAGCVEPSLRPARKKGDENDGGKAGSVERRAGRY